MTEQQKTVLPVNPRPAKIPLNTYPSTRRSSRSANVDAVSKSTSAKPADGEVTKLLLGEING